MAEAIRCKGKIVEADPFDRLGVRAKLNLGHTFGRALEALSGFSLPHGLAVAVGLQIATRLAAAIGLQTLRNCPNEFAASCPRSPCPPRFPVPARGRCNRGDAL